MARPKPQALTKTGPSLNISSTDDPSKSVTNRIVKMKVQNKLSKLVKAQQNPTKKSSSQDESVPME